jgi:hypothetical protein
MTSLGGVDLADLNDLQAAYRMNYLPVYPTEAHPLHGIMLRLSNGHVLKKQSYVNANQRHDVKFEHLVRFEDGIRCFDDESLKILKERSGFADV